VSDEPEFPDCAICGPCSCDLGSPARSARNRLYQAERRLKRLEAEGP